jgi:hypothetical protein
MITFKKALSMITVLAMIMLFTVNYSYATEVSFTYSAEAQKLNDLGLYKGVSEVSFVPDLGSTLNRETGVVMLLRIFGLENDASAITDADATLAKFSDAASISSWAKNAVAYAVKNSLVVGYPDGTFGPKASLNGKSYATMILRQLGFTPDYNNAPAELADKGGLTTDEARKFASKELIKDDLVGISFGVLSATDKDGKKVIENLVENKIVDGTIILDSGAIAPEVQQQPTESIVNVSNHSNHNNNNSNLEPSYTVTGLSNHAGGDTIILEFSVPIDTTTLNQELLRLGSTVFIDYIDEDSQVNPIHMFSLNNASAAWTNSDKTFTIALNESTDNAYINSEKYVGITLEGVESKVGAEVPAEQVISEEITTGENESPSLVSWTLDMNSGILTMTFDELINADSFDISGITIKNELEPTESVVLSDSTCTNSNFVSTLSVTLSDNDKGWILSQETLAETEGTSFIELSADALRDVAGNSINHLTDSTGLLTFFQPELPSLDINSTLMNGGQYESQIEDNDQIMLQFTKIMDAEAIGTDFDILVTDGIGTANSSVITIAKDGTEDILATIVATNQQYSNDGNIEFNSSFGEWSMLNTRLTIYLVGLAGGSVATEISPDTLEFTLGPLAVDINGNAGTNATTGAEGSF